MILVLKQFFFIIFFSGFFFFSEAVHHHTRIYSNFFFKTKYLWSNRLIIFDTNELENKLLKSLLIRNKCELDNRKLKIFYKKNNSYFDLENDNREASLNFNLPFKVSLIGIDGELKFKSAKLQNFERYFEIIDDMPFRQQEAKDDQLCLK